MTNAMYIGLGPEYNYPGTYGEWAENNTRYSSNHGASLISRSIAKEFNADYVDDFSDLSFLNNKYDVCFVAFATHINATRDISYYADIVEKLEMKVVALSLGVQDYMGGDAGAFSLHPSVIRFLNVVSAKSDLIGVRGHYTASILYRAGFSNVLAIGCPTVYSNLSPELKVIKKERYSKPLCVYQCSMAEHIPSYLNDVAILGQDFQDHLIFTGELENDLVLKNIYQEYYDQVDSNEFARNNISKRGVFPSNHEEWYSIIKKHDFVYGPRLHANIAALLKGIPAVMFARDLRVREMAEFFSLPHVTYEEAKRTSLVDIYESANFEDFNETYPIRYSNYLYFLAQNGVEHELADKCSKEFKVTAYDTRINRYLSCSSVSKVNETNLGYIKWRSRLGRIKQKIFSFV